MSLFNYMLYYYLIQAQNNHDKHRQADQMAAALLKLKRSRGTDPIPTLISTTAGQNALLAMLQSVAQNNPAQLLTLMASIRGGGVAQRPQPQPQQRPLAGFGQAYGQGFAGGAGGFGSVSSGGGFGGYPSREQLYQQGFPPSGGSSFGGLQASRTLYSPQVQQALYRPQPAAAAHPPTLPFTVGDEKLDNSLQFSPSLRRQVYAPQPELEPTPAPARTVIREPSTRLHVSTVTLVTTVVSSRRSTVPLVYNGQSTTTEILATATHTVTATKLQTLAVVVTPTVVEANGQTTTLYGGTGSPAAEIVTDLNYHDEPAAAAAGVTATVQQQPAVATAAPEGLPAPAAQQAAAALGQLLIQPGQTPPLGPVAQPAVTTTTTSTTTTTTKKPDRLLALLKSRAQSRRRGTPRLSAPRRGDPRRRKKNQEAEATKAEEHAHVSTSVSVSVSQPGQPPAAPVTLVDGVPVVQAVPITTTTTTPAPAPVFQPGQVPVYVEKDGVLVIAAAPLQPAEPAPAATPTAPVFRPEPVTAAPTVPPPPAPTAATAAPAPAAVPEVVIAAVTPAPTPPPTPPAPTPPPPDDFSFDFEETVYASPSTSTEKVVTEEAFQNLLDGTFVILAKSLPDAVASSAPVPAAPAVPVEGSGQADSDVKVSVSYAVSTSVSEGRRR